jgi:hypothetical protein
VANKIHVCEYGSHILDEWAEPAAETFAVRGKHYTQIHFEQKEGNDP